MAVYQLIYTSSKRGYGVFSKSSEIKPDESRQITINTAYKRPQTLINSNETNYEKFPVNLSRFRLSNQKWVIAQSTYVGLDNTGRQGNFFTHALLLPSSKDFSKKYLYFPYRQSLTDEEKELTNPQSVLPQVNDFEISTQATYNFAKENATKLALFIQSFLDAQRSRKKLGIEDTNENIILWIKFLYDVMPVKLLEEIEFTTYTDRITSAFDIVGIYDPSIVKDLSRFINFDGKDNNVEIGSFAKAIVDDYVNRQSKDLFYFFSNSMKREELLQSIDSLYSTLNTSDVSIEDVFSLIKNLPKNDLAISNEIIQFLLNSDFLHKFDDSQTQFVLNLIEPSENSTEYNSIIYKIAFSCKKSTLDMLVSNIKPNQKLFQDIDQTEKNDNINFLMLCLKIKSNISPFNNDRFVEIFDLASLISGTKNDWLKAPLNQLIDQLIMTFPRNDGIHSESDLKFVLNKLKNYVSSEVLSERVSNRFRNEIKQQEGINNLAIRNSTLLIVLGGEMKDLVSMLRNYDSKEDQPRILQVLATIYNTLNESAEEDSSVMTKYKSLYPIYIQSFDHLSRGKQKNFIKRYRRVFGNKSQVSYRPPIILYSLMGVLALSIIGFGGFLFLDGRPKLINNLDQSEVSALLFAKVINDGREIPNFINTPEELIIDLAKVVMSDFTLSNSGTLVASYNTNRNRVEFTPTDANFFSPKFVVMFEEVELETSPIVFISGILYQPGQPITVEVDYDQIYSGNVYDMLNEILGTVKVTDETIKTYQPSITSLGLNFSDDDFDSINNQEFQRFIILESKMFEELDRRRSIPESSLENFELNIINHAGNKTSIQIQINIDASSIQIREEFPYFTDRLISKMEGKTPRKDLVVGFLASLNIIIDDLTIVDGFGFEFLTLESQSGTVNFQIPINRILSEESPTLELVNSGNTQIEIDWVDRIENDYDGLIQDIYSLIGDVVVNDSGLQLVFNEELYRSFLSEYLINDNSLQTLSTFKHPFLDLVVSDKSEAIDSQNSDEESFVINLSVSNVYGVSSSPIEIVIKTPIPVEE